MKKIVKAIGYAGATLVGIVGLYLAAAWGLPRISVAKAGPQAAPNAAAMVPVFIRTNGVHTDIVVPIKTSRLDWSQQLPFAHTTSGDTTMRYVAFGWGDKGFYLHTRTWDELKFSTAFYAAFGLSSSAMHTTYLHAIGAGPDTVPLYLSPAEYAQLVAYIQASFQYDAAGRVQHIRGHSYGPNDAFYEARRVYSIFHTCNTWANNALKAGGQKACFWTPTDSGIFYQYGR